MVSIILLQSEMRDTILRSPEALIAYKTRIRHDEGDVDGSKTCGGNEMRGNQWGEIRAKIHASLAIDNSSGNILTSIANHRRKGQIKRSDSIQDRPARETPRGRTP